MNPSQSANIKTITHVVEFGGEIIASGPDELTVMREAINIFQKRGLVPKSLKRYTIPPSPPGMYTTGHLEPVKIDSPKK